MFINLDTKLSKCTQMGYVVFYLLTCNDNFGETFSLFIVRITILLILIFFFYYLF